MNTTSRYLLIFITFLLFFYRLNAAGLGLGFGRYEEMRVGQIDIVLETEGNVQKSLLKSRMKTKEGSLFNQHDFDEDLKILAKEFDRVEPVMTVNNGQLDITLKLWSKPTIRSITWIGNKDISTEKLEQELDIPKNSVFDRQAFNRAFHKLKNYYVKKGYFEAALDYDVIRDRRDNVVDIIIKVKEGRAGRIQEIVFHGVTPDEEEELLNLMMTKSYNFFTSWLTQEGTLNPEIFRHDELAILNFLHNSGYADAKLNVEIKPAKPERVIIDITVDKGPLYTFGNVTIQGNTLFTKDELLALAGIKKGEPYSPERVRQAIKTITDKYGSKGYVDAYVTPDVRLNAAEHSYSVTLRVEEGSRYRIGLIKVFGNHHTQTDVILHETSLIPGNVFDTTLLHNTEERLRNIGYFSNVNVYAVKTTLKTADSSHFRDVHIEVEEKSSTGNFNLYTSFSTTESVAFGFGVRENSFNFRGIPSVFTKGLRALRGGNEFLSANATIGKKQLSYTLSWSKPYFMDTPWIVGFELQKARNTFTPEYTTRSYTAIVHGHYSINAFLNWGVHYRLRRSIIKLKPEKHQDKELVRQSKNGGLISAVGTSLFYDSTDHPVKPHRGIRSTLELEYAGFGGDHHFGSVQYLNNAYLQPYRYGLLRFRGNLQFIKTFASTTSSKLPLTERFYLGSELAMRGYRYNAVGPHFHDKKHTPKGGVSAVLFSADYEQYIFKKLDGFVFLDIGNVSFKQFSIGSLRYTTGGGLKIKISENMPLVIGLGYPLNPARSSEVKHLFISFGAAF